EALRKLEMRGSSDPDIQPHVFQINPRKGLRGLRKVLGLPNVPRVIEGVDIAHFQGADTVASLVSFIDGTPVQPGYRRFKMKAVGGCDVFASMREVVSRRFRGRREEDRVFPAILLTNGEKGQLNPALDAFRLLDVEPPAIISLAKKEEEIYQPGEGEPL